MNMMAMSREFVDGEAEVKRLHNTSGIIGESLIELCWEQLRPNTKKVSGFEVAVLAQQEIGDGRSARVSSSFHWDNNKHTRFYPTTEGRAYAYVFDTPANRKILYNSFRTGWFFITDPKLREEIKNEAIENGYEVNYAEKPTMNVKKTRREIAAENKAKKVEEKAKSMEQQLQEALDKIAELSSKEEARKVKPLGGVKINKDKVKQSTEK